MSEEPKALRDRRAVSSICSALHRAYRDTRFYPRDHPVALQSLDALARVLLRFVGDEGALTLTIEEGRLIYEEGEVYSHAETRDNLAFIMFRDGLRAITFQTGLEQPEIEALVDCLSRADELVRLDQDLVTVFWEQDFAHIDYQAADPFLAGGYLRHGTVDALRETVLRRLGEGELGDTDGVASAALGKLAVVPRIDLPAAALALTPQEIEASEDAAAGAATVLDDFALVLLEVISGRGSQTTDAGVIGRAVHAIIQAFVESSDLQALTFFLDELEKLEAAGKCEAGLVSKMVAEAVSVGAVQFLMAGLGTASAERVAKVEDFLSLIRRWTYPTLLEVLAESPDRAVRKTLLATLRKEGGVPPEFLSPWLQDKRWYVARNAAQLATVWRDPSLLAPLERLMRHPDPRVRREAGHALEAYGGEAALAGLARALEDPDPTMRILGARGVAQFGGREQEEVVAAQVLGRDFETRSPEEIEAMLLAYARLAGERAVPFLDRFWRRRLLRPRPVALRLAAVQALGMISGAGARGSLTDASKSGDGAIRRAANRALENMRALQRDPR